MAALRPCPSGLVVGARRLSIGSSSRVRMSPKLGRMHSTSPLKTSAVRTTAAHLRHRHTIRAHNGDIDDLASFPVPDGDRPMTEEEFNKFRKALKKHNELDKDMPFREDILKIDEYRNKMTSWNTSIFHMKATGLSLHLCLVVKHGVELASRIMESAAIRLDKQDEISFYTTKQTMMAYVSIFVKLAEDTYHKKFNVESVFSLLGAFRGMAAISHILLEDAMASVNYADDNSSKYSLVHEIENSRLEYAQKMRNLEHNFRAVSNSTKAYELLRPTMEEAMILAMFFVLKMIARRETVLGHVRGAKPRRAMSSDDQEPDTTETASDST
ncbi:hypothetical protein EJB05_39864 [Eragrostis curvula]|uniref:Uncharacterized protein n=1 Tax=Eragrostis curvula TaxID=38414 RepID=A0A5J9TYP7_9POAL|nr:hypothetical protein EJB05_39864 [Eragrostis curvula]